MSDQNSLETGMSVKSAKKLTNLSTKPLDLAGNYIYNRKPNTIGFVYVADHVIVDHAGAMAGYHLSEISRI
jgi:hypothetical protein